MFDFDRETKRMEKRFGIVALFSILVNLAILSGIGFIVYKVLMHFGIL